MDDAELLVHMITTCAELESMPQVSSATFQRPDAAKPPVVTVVMKGRIESTVIRGTLFP